MCSLVWLLLWVITSPDGLFISLQLSSCVRCDNYVVVVVVVLNSGLRNFSFYRNTQCISKYIKHNMYCYIHV